MSTDKIITCPNEYGPRFVKDGVSRGAYGECVCKRHGETPCQYQDSREPVELPRDHDLEPRRWQMPDGSIVGEAVNMEAVRLLRDDPDEYFRRTRRPAQTEE